MKNASILTSLCLLMVMISCKKDDINNNDNTPINVTFKQLDQHITTSSIPVSGTNIDINQDGISDFSVYYSYSRVTFPSYDAPYTDYYNISIKSTNKDFDILTHDDNLYGNFPTKTVEYANLYNENDIIDGTETDWTEGASSSNTVYLAYFSRSWSTSNGYSNETYKNQPITTAFRYIGIRMVDDFGNYKYGWMKVKVTSNNNLESITIESAAIHNIEETEIKAGQKK